MKAIFASLMFASLLATGAERRPNLVFILADDLGWRDTSLYGSTYYETPNLERLARRGVRGHRSRRRRRHSRDTTGSSGIKKSWKPRYDHPRFAHKGSSYT